MDAGEALFAAHGIDHVRMQEINRLAEVANDSAVNYHFGSRQGLVAAILERHHLEVDAAVDELVAARGSDTDLEGHIRTVSEALAGQLGSGSGRCYLLILGEVFTRGVLFPTLSPAAGGADRQVEISNAGLAVLAELARIDESLGHLSDALRIERLHRLADFAVASFASRARAESLDVPPALGRREFVDNFVIMATAAAQS
jgi:TetR/AcrR family transcriptional regulator, regulator of cefoperazone and chloramphenicol sensitivity